MEPATKRALLDSAARLAREVGMSAVTTQRVSSAAGVTKGAFFHYFPTRASLVLAMFEDVMARFDADIDRRVEADPGRGSFTRAYVGSVFDDLAQGQSSDWAPMAAAMLDDGACRARWSSWIASRDRRHESTDQGVALWALRLAADGVWYSSLLGALPANVESLREKLMADTCV